MPYKNLFMISKISMISFVTFFLISCGSKDSSKDEPVVVYGTMTLSNSVDGNDNATAALTGVSVCTRNADTGRVDVTITQGSGKPSLTLAIKDYSSVAKTYSCVQAADNAASASDVGGKFESCMIAASVLASPNLTTINTYNMYRETTAVQPFTHTGSCSIDVTTATPSIAGTVSCTGMVQTVYQGVARHPLNSEMTADVESDFRCNF